MNHMLYGEQPDRDNVNRYDLFECANCEKEFYNYELDEDCYCPECAAESQRNKFLELKYKSKKLTKLLCNKHKN